VSDATDEIEAIEIRLFLEAIWQRWGYDLRDYAPPSMSRRVRAVLAASHAAHLGELQHRVLHDREAFADVIEGLTVRVTELFRDPTIYRVIRSSVVPLLRTYPSLKIWHAGCASGEEAYAMAILLEEEGLGGRAQIYATDLSQRAVDHAREGVYAATHLVEFARNHVQSGARSDIGDWLTAAYGGVAMRESLRSRVLFFQHDLVSDQAFGEMNVVFCRNVLIYFNADLRARVLRKIADSLCGGGFLCIGTSERLSEKDLALGFSMFSEDERIYRYLP
jgi:chemotaxis protein methyltransferase CheR